MRGKIAVVFFFFVLHSAFILLRSLTMSQTKSQIQSLLAGAETEPRHRFGQNFMIDQNLVRIVAAAGEIVAGDVAVEVGPGTGTLTEELLASPADRVVAIEIDCDLAKMLRERFAGNGRFQLIEGDALSGKHELNAELLDILKPSGASAPARFKLIANLPYNIASPLVIEMLLAGVDLLAFTVQKEVGERLKATGGDNYGPLSVMANLLAEVEILRTLPPQAFWPAPKIDSALVRMIRRDQLGADAVRFGLFVQKVFSFRRKTLRKALTMAGVDSDLVLNATHSDGQRRPEEFPPEKFLQMFRSIEQP
jgi:16S rRNA (adenine1518-N6/adenine1519-N6)-dimethyltransferase